MMGIYPASDANLVQDGREKTVVVAPWNTSKQHHILTMVYSGLSI